MQTKLDSREMKEENENYRNERFVGTTTGMP